MNFVALTPSGYKPEPQYESMNIYKGLQFTSSYLMGNDDKVEDARLKDPNSLKTY